MKRMTRIFIVLVLLVIVIILGIRLVQNNNHETPINNSYEVNNMINSTNSIDEVNVVEADEVEEGDDTSELIVNENEISKGQTSNKECKCTYYIKVNYTQNVVTIYQKDEEGNYIIPFKVMLCSCGTATPHSGIYASSKGYAWGTVVGGLYAQYSTRIKGNILFHSIPYKSEAKDSMEYWEYDKLGTTASAGCVRLRVADCKWIFDNCEEGTLVEFYSSSIPSPFAKPELEKISDNVECRNWDPTDDVPENPWKKYINE